MSHPATASIRVLLTGIPRLLRSVLLDTLSRESDLEVEVLGGEELGVPTARPPHVVVTSLEERRLPGPCLDLLMAHPQVRILGLVAHARQSFLVELRPRRIALGELSPEGLVEAIRATARRPSLAARLERVGP